MSKSAGTNYTVGKSSAVSYTVYCTSTADSGSTSNSGQPGGFLNTDINTVDKTIIMVHTVFPVNMHSDQHSSLCVQYNTTLI